MQIKLIKTLTLIVVVFLSANSSAVVPTHDNIPNQQIDIIKRDLQKTVIEAQQQFKLIGLSVAVFLPQQHTPLILTTGSSLIKIHKPISPSSLFQVGSITKTFTAALVTQAVNNKYLSLNDKLNKFFPEYISWENITVGELVNQTSGIFDYIDSKDWWHKVFLSNNRVWDAKSLIDIAYQYPVKFSAGAGWAYSNTNYVLLGLILEKVTNKSLDELMNALIRNANLKHTFYLISDYPKNIVARMTHGYGFYDTIEDMTTQNGSIWHASAAMMSSPEDLVHWWHIIFATNTINRFPVTHYLHLKNVEDGSNTTTIEQTGYDLGLFRMNTPEGVVWFTPGLTSGYTTGVVYAPCLDLYFAYSTNKAPVKGLHKFMIMNLLHAMNNNKDYQKLLFVSDHIPSYCSQIKTTKKFIFPLQ